MRSPSSLIFVVLLGVWAAFFVQYWIRRRDHLATARSVEQFSAAMRVLERRPAIPRTDLSDPTPRSVALHPARSSRPQVVVKRAEPVGRSGFDLPAPVTASASRSPEARSARVRPARRVRALVLLLSLVATLAVGGLAAFLVVPWWSPLLGLGAVVASFAWVRAAVRAEASIRAARRRRAHDHARRRATAPVSPVAHHATSRPATMSERSDSTPAASAPASETPADEKVEASTPAVAVAQAAEPVAEPAMPEPEPEPVIEYVHLVDEDDIPITWDPVPVPRPTYTMKAKAERPDVAPAEVTPEPQPVDASLLRADELDERRAAGA